MIAADIMTENPLTAHPATPLHDVIRTMMEAGIRHVPITDGNELVGILSERDLRGVSLSIWESPERAAHRLRSQVSSWMTADVVSIAPDTGLAELIDLLLDNHVGAVPVVDPVEGDVVGIVSYVDALRAARQAFVD